MRFRDAGRPVAPIVVSFLACSAWGADSTTADTAVIQEVMVTAQKRVSSLQDTPVAVTALDESLLVNAHVKDLQDISKNVPGLVVSSTGTHAHHPFSIRGISPATIGTTIDDPVGVYVDGVYIGRAPGVMTDLFYVDRIEVLRGPQGTLYGRNTPAGAINVIHKRPGSELSGQVQLSGTSEDDLRGRFAIDGPIADDKLRGALSLAYTDQEGWGTNLFDGSRVNSQESVSAYASLEVLPSENSSVIARMDFTDQETVDGLKRITSGTPPNFVLNIGDPDEFNFNDPSFVDLQVGGFSLSASFDAGPVTFDSISAYRWFRLDGAVDSDGLAVDTQGNPGSQFNNVNDQSQEQFSQEFRLTSADGGALKWLAGLYAYHEAGERVIRVTNFTTGGLLHRYSDVETTSLAAYASADYEVTSRLTLSAGVRVSEERKNITKEHDNVDFRNNPPRPGFARVPLNTSKDDWSAVTPKFSIAYEATDDLDFYLSAANGFKSGGFSDVGRDPAFGQEEVWSYEAGMKAYWLDRRLRTNLAVFNADYTGLQVNVSIAPSVFTILNAADATMQGAELEVLALPTDRLEIQAVVAYLDATYDNFLGLGNEQLAGNRLNRAPEWSGSATIEYRVPLSPTAGSLLFRGSYAYQSDTYFTELNLPQFGAESWEDVDARVSYESAGGRWTVSAFGRNLTDDRHVTNVTPLGGHAVAGFNAPRQYGLEVVHRFGN